MANRRLAGAAVLVVLAISARAAEGAIRTDRLTGKAVDRWRAIVAIVEARDAAGRPAHPRLNALWHAVAANECAVFVELPAPSGHRGYVVGEFTITKLAADGRALEGVVVMNLPAIDHAAAGPGAARRDGFIPFAKLGRTERYAEVLRHELAHAVWAFSSAERARVAMVFGQEVRAASRRVLVAQSAAAGSGVEDAARLARLSRAYEEPAEAAEEAVWAELVVERAVR